MYLCGYNKNLFNVVKFDQIKNESSSNMASISKVSYVDNDDDNDNDEIEWSEDDVDIENDDERDFEVTISCLDDLRSGCFKTANNSPNGVSGELQNRLTIGLFRLLSIFLCIFLHYKKHWCIVNLI